MVREHIQSMRDDPRSIRSDVPRLATCLALKNRVELSPTRRKLRKSIGFITFAQLKGQHNFDNRNAYMYYNPYIYDIHKYAHVTSHRVGVAWVRVALPRGLACHIAPAWVSRKI